MDPMNAPAKFEVCIALPISELIVTTTYWRQRSREQAFITCDSIYAIARICHANSVCQSVTRLYCIKTAECIIEILSRSDKPIILVFRHQRSLYKSEVVTPNGGAKYKGESIFDQYAAISRKR